MRTCRSRLSLYTMWAQGSNSASLVWQQVPLPPEPSHWLPFSWTPGWHQTHYVLKDDPGLSIFLAVCPKCWDDRSVPPYLVLSHAEIEPVASSTPVSTLPTELHSSPVSVFHSTLLSVGAAFPEPSLWVVGSLFFLAWDFLSLFLHRAELCTGPA